MFVIIVILIVSGLDRVFSTGAEWVFGGGGPGEGQQEQAPAEEIAPEDLDLGELDIEGDGGSRTPRSPRARTPRSDAADRCVS